MRETTQVEEFEVRGRKAGDKICSILKSGQASQILVEDDLGHVLMDIDGKISQGFMPETLDIARGLIKTIKSCRLVVFKNQLMLFS